jgi:hypothetical protein
MVIRILCLESTTGFEIKMYVLKDLKLDEPTTASYCLSACSYRLL